MKRFAVPIEFKDLGGAGEFEGYAAVFGNIDHGGDILMPGAFKSIEFRKNGKVVVLNQHNQQDPIGLADVTVDDVGLRVKGQLVLEADSARSAYALMQAGALDGMSFGYEVMPGGASMKDGIRYLNSVKLYEVSPVTFGMNPLAMIDSVKSRLEGGTLPTMKDFERLLREAGFSNTQAKTVANGGLGKLLRREVGDTAVKADSASIALASLRLHL